MPTATFGAAYWQISQGSLAWDTTVQLLPLILISLFVIKIIEGKSVRALKGIWPITLASGIAFAVPELLAARFLGAELPALIGSGPSMAVTILMARKNPQSREKNILLEIRSRKRYVRSQKNTITIAEAVKACIPFTLIFAFLLLKSSMVPPLHDTLGKIKTVVRIYSGKGGTPYTFTWVATPGVLILLAAVIGGKIQGADISLIGKVFKDTCRQMWKTVVTIMSIMAMAKII
ncbi:MAG: L-lactate permease [Dorea sp.]